MVEFWAAHGYAVPDQLQDAVQGDGGIDTYGPDQFCESEDN